MIDVVSKKYIGSKNVYVVMYNYQKNGSNSCFNNNNNLLKLL